jgi:hypothetical protein
MPLSEHEQRILDEIERRLAAEDPKFARATTVATPRGQAARRFKRAIGGFVLGFLFLIAGLVVGLDDPKFLFAFGLVGFTVMLLSVVTGVKASKDLGPRARAPRRSTWFQRMEDRWKKRFEDGSDRS